MYIAKQILEAWRAEFSVPCLQSTQVSHHVEITNFREYLLTHMVWECGVHKQVQLIKLNWDWDGSSKFFRHHFLQVLQFPASQIQYFRSQVRCRCRCSVGVVSWPQSTAAVKIANKSVANQAFCRQDVNKIVGTSWTIASDKHNKYF